MSSLFRSANRPDPDKVITDIADYVLDYDCSAANTAMETARYMLMDSMSCALMALQYPACLKLMGPVVPGAEMSGGCPIPGLSYRLDPITAAFNIGALVRWLDFNDTWLAAEWGHPSDNLGAILACCDYLSRQSKRNITLKDVLTAAIKAHEIQGVIALENSFNRVGLDHVMLVRIASTAVSAMLLGGSREEVINAVSHAWLDGSSLRTYRHAPNTGSRKSWAAGDASARGLRLALLALKGEMGYPTALSAPNWGFQDVLFKGEEVKFLQNYGTYVMENILFKISFPAEFHAQTAVECALKLHPEVKDRIAYISKIVIDTQESAVRIIDKTGKLDNPADRDHCIQYMVAVPLITGQLTAADYEDDRANNLPIDELREKMEVREEERFTREYLDPQKRSIGNAVQVFFTDGSSTEKVSIDYPVGHKFRREEGIPLLKDKFNQAIAQTFAPKQQERILGILSDQARCEATPVHEFMDTIAYPA